MIKLRLVLVASFIATVVVVTPAIAEEISPLEFAKLYVRQIHDSERLRKIGEAENSEVGANKMANCVRNMAKLQIEYSAQSSTMQNTKVSGETAGFPAMLAEEWKMKSDAYGAFANACSAMMAGPKPGVDYGTLAGNLPRLTALIQSVDHAVLESSSLVFAPLISMRADHEGHASHLVITNKERNDLVEEIDLLFSANELNGDHVQDLVGSISVLRDYLTKKGFKGADEPW